MKIAPNSIRLSDWDQNRPSGAVVKARVRALLRSDGNAMMASSLISGGMVPR